jgi:hypothetical protein
MRKGKELKAPRHASAAATRNGNLPSRDSSLRTWRQLALFPTLYVFYAPRNNLLILLN